MTEALILIGNVNVDLVMGPLAPWPQPGTEVILPNSELRVGGAAGNTALALEALGVDYRLVASRGNDVLGHWLAEPFGRRAAAWARAEAPTTVSVGIGHPDGERTFLTTTGHLHAFTLADVLAQLDDEGGGRMVLLVGPFVTPALLDDYDQLIGVLCGRGYRIALDTGWPDGGWTEAVRARVRGWIARCDHLLINDIEAKGLSGADTPACAASAILPLLPAGATLVVKCGPRGAMAWRGADHVDIAAPAVDVVDTIGAGDTFSAGYFAALAEGADLAAAVTRGVTVASLAVSTSPRRYK
ncbi:carbohydrate kinase family protein [Labrys monachus]|uniref:Sugar/nucleoside kinase (Ribokinase family) n=1 Tax=Labrys monachus TaxID=217067 RepID=A0ABU0FCJ3_9HYPH|nr:carbohydrate kinase family protein [Labrys monachus]MDQ0392334.1 sugar/nucleoside kinase (ribokinase family) [Labrys monachus]